MQLLGLILVMVIGWFLIDKGQDLAIKKCSQGIDIVLKGQVLHCSRISNTTPKS